MNATAYGPDGCRALRNTWILYVPTVSFIGCYTGDDGLCLS